MLFESLCQFTDLMDSTVMSISNFLPGLSILPYLDHFPRNIFLMLCFSHLALPSSLIFLITNASQCLMMSVNFWSKNFISVFILSAAAKTRVLTHVQSNCQEEKIIYDYSVACWLFFAHEATPTKWFDPYNISGRLCMIHQG